MENRGLPIVRVDQKVACACGGLCSGQCRENHTVDPIEYGVKNAPNTAIRCTAAYPARDNNVRR